MNNSMIIDMPENRCLAFDQAQADHMKLSTQARAATRTTVWVRDGELYYSGQWSGYHRPPEGEIKDGRIPVPYFY